MLLADAAAVLLLPLPDAPQELLAAEVVAALLLGPLQLRSTTIWVAMPAWSVPGSHSALNPPMRCQRMRMSWMVVVSACPMCSEPVTLGGGITME